MASAALTSTRARSAIASPLRVLAAIGVAGVLVGVPVGLLGRAMMKVGALAAGPSLAGVHTSAGNVVGDFTLNGTAALVIFSGVLPSIALGALYVSVRPLLRPLGRWRGLALGAYGLALAGPLVLEPGNNDFVRFGPPALNVLMFAALFIVAGLAVAPLVDASLRAAASPSSVPFPVLMAGLLLGGAVVIAMAATGIAGAWTLVAGGERTHAGDAAALLSWSAAAGLSTRVPRLRSTALAVVGALLALGTWLTAEALRFLLSLAL